MSGRPNGSSAGSIGPSPGPLGPSLRLYISPNSKSNLQNQFPITCNSVAQVNEKTKTKRF